MREARALRLWRRFVFKKYWGAELRAARRDDDETLFCLLPGLFEGSSSEEEEEEEELEEATPEEVSTRCSACGCCRCGYRVLASLPRLLLRGAVRLLLGTPELRREWADLAVRLAKICLPPGLAIAAAFLQQVGRERLIEFFSWLAGYG